ncbi:hypothetical protein, unlikely [Trypanosoma congolense IL3000]|uniref:Uncharacterized protein n=1 Tax=Trypanosoma congolense (strain IL3000) TaxID=1068625 RepID=F9W3I4_TRYCI|nr:hypothetical protein, unlikely [Trypanosoma congolense IL3000]
MYFLPSLRDQPSNFAADLLSIPNCIWVEASRESPSCPIASFRVLRVACLVLEVLGGVGKLVDPLNATIFQGVIVIHADTRDMGGVARMTLIFRSIHIPKHPLYLGLRLFLSTALSNSAGSLLIFLRVWVSGDVLA